MSNKAPSAGTKVTTGEDIPTKREATGKVAQDSLAAESLRKGGEFAANTPAGGQYPEQGPQKQSQQHSGTHQTSTGAGTGNKTTSLGQENQQTSSGTGQTSTGSGGGLESQRSYAGPAPTYVYNQWYREPGGPHGKNIKEGGFEGSGTEGGPLPEPGSMEDPSRIATGLGGGGGGVSEGKKWKREMSGSDSR
ncbi:hypothetical protein C7999DRAFT_39201 [Corynascus novoguineensis]|uniref:Uncharacterized protein n=1 Tax=Corynascus novoguineensis TaxID=1126955 RepID=A0AAN7CWJ4_9PEZI|nr:hypothetical protein C7999DRAFT_39201 [Corynascus novoguineensis]